MNITQVQPNSSNSNSNLIVYPAPDLGKIIDTIYPIGSIFITSEKVDTCPLQTLGCGTWKKISAGRVLQGASASKDAGTTVEAGLPNIKGGAGNMEERTGGSFTGPFKKGEKISDQTWGGGIWENIYPVTFDASLSSSIYGKSNTVQPPAYLVNIFERVS